MKLNTIIVDDEPVARKGIREFAEKIDFIEVIGEARDIESLLSLMEDSQIDLLFMDIEMPGLSGIEFARSYEKKLPLIVFVTAYHQFAVESYDLAAVDYVLKPVSFERLAKAADRALEIADSRNKKRKDGAPFFVRHEGRYHRIDPGQVVYVSALQNYVRLYMTSGDQFVVRSTLKDFEQQLNSSQVLMVHKSYLVNCSFVESIASNHIQVKDYGQIPVGRAYKDAVFQRLLGDL